MCMNCGCGDWNTKHRPTDITLDMLKAAAQGQNTEAEQAADNIHAGAWHLKQEGRIT